MCQLPKHSFTQHFTKGYFKLRSKITQSLRGRSEPRQRLPEHFTEASVPATAVPRNRRAVARIPHSARPRSVLSEPGASATEAGLGGRKFGLVVRPKWGKAPAADAEAAFDLEHRHAPDDRLLYEQRLMSYYIT